jgi:chemotaxis protein MotB
MRPRSRYQSPGGGRSRKSHTEEHENHERWLVSYADFITLLFAFFVVMYSISSVNEGKYRVLSDSIISAFHDPLRSMDPIQVGNLVKVKPQDKINRDRNWSVIPIIRQPFPLPRPIKKSKKDDLLDAASRKLADEIEESLAELVDDDLVKVRREKNWIEIEMKSSILFPSGSATLSTGSLPVLSKIAEKLGPFESTISVEGFTDNVPISTPDFPSNWELSSSRSVSVVHLFSKLGIEPSRMAAIGYGEFRPIDSNAYAEGRSKNRRVVLVIKSGKPPRVSKE